MPKKRYWWMIGALISAALTYFNNQSELAALPVEFQAARLVGAAVAGALLGALAAWIAGKRYD